MRIVSCLNFVFNFVPQYSCAIRWHGVDDIKESSLIIYISLWILDTLLSRIEIVLGCKYLKEVIILKSKQDFYHTTPSLCLIGYSFSRIVESIYKSDDVWRYFVVSIKRIYFYTHVKFECLKRKSARARPINRWHLSQWVNDIEFFTK